MNKTKTKTKNLKESEFIRYIENNPVVSTAGDAANLLI